MTEFKHTPGKWVVAESRCSDGHAVWMGGAESDPYSYNSHHKWECNHFIDIDEECEIGRKDFEESEANAHLIAAAPELLSDLIEAERMFLWYGDMHAAKPDMEKAARNYEMADRFAATIAKATGSTS